MAIAAELAPVVQRKLPARDGCGDLEQDRQGRCMCGYETCIRSRGNFAIGWYAETSVVEVFLISSTSTYLTIKIDCATIG
jgi:hypothetical protein